MANKIRNSGFRDWSPKQLPKLKGKIYLVTGGNSGIGYEAARFLGEAGGDVILACRSVEKGEKAQKKLRKKCKGEVHLVALDLADLASIRSAAEEVRGLTNKLDALINNAGIMQTPELRTNDGFELQLGTNHLGHFVLTSRLIGLVEGAAGRVVQVSSIAHRFGDIHLDDLMLEKSGYSPMKAYGQSKLANLMFAFELDRRLNSAGAKSIALACHPGYAATELQNTGPEGLSNFIYKLTNPIMAQSAAKGAVPTVLAAAGEEAQRGAYYGPQGLGEARGRVGDAKVADAALNEQVAAALWSASEALVGEKFDMPA